MAGAHQGKHVDSRGQYRCKRLIRHLPYRWPEIWAAVANLALNQAAKAEGEDERSREPPEFVVDELARARAALGATNSHRIR